MTVLACEGEVGTVAYKVLSEPSGKCKFCTIPPGLQKKFGISSQAVCLPLRGRQQTDGLRAKAETLPRSFGSTWTT